MSTQIVRVEGYNKGSLGTIGRECDRAKGVNHRNEDINAAFSENNISYKDAPYGFTHEWSDIVTALNAQGKVTKNGVAFEGMIITADLAFFEALGYEPDEHRLSASCRKFFDDAYEFAKAQIGYQGTDRNIIAAKIHLDEKTPHLHLYYVPITEKWQSKVYAKDADGRVLRTEKGTPIQAQDGKGKTIYEQHEDVAAPKLSKTEFWRVRGGQHSYSMMQDRFQEMVGQKYGLERGEVGADRKHRTKYQWEQAQLQAEKETITAEVTPLRELKTGIDEVAAAGKTVFPGVVAIKKKDLDTVKAQAKAYTVNRDEVESVRERSAAVSQREQQADQRERQLDVRAQQLQVQREQVQREYQRQRSLNQLLEASERAGEEKDKEISRLKTENSGLKAQISSLTAEMGRVKAECEKKIKSLTEKLRGAYTSLASVVEAAGMLKYHYEKDRNGNTIEGKYRVSNLSKAQENLIDGMAKYGVKWAKEDGFPELAEEMQESVGFSKGIKSYIEPEIRSRGYDMEL